VTTFAQQMLGVHTGVDLPLASDDVAVAENDG
jgi:hypothetical protein